MKFKTRSILQELNEIAEKRDTESLIQSRATNIIDSAVNLIESMYKAYPEDVALELERRFINSIKGADSSKFNRGIKKIVENKRADKKNEN